MMVSKQGKWQTLKTNKAFLFEDDNHLLISFARTKKDEKKVYGWLYLIL